MGLRTDPDWIDANKHFRAQEKTMPPSRKKKVIKRTASATAPAKRGLPTSPSTQGSALNDYISLFFGQPGVGKTTFVNDFGRVLFMSTDRGTRFLDAMRIECLEWGDFTSALDLLEKPGAAKNYDFVAIDHLSDMSDMAERAVLDRLRIDSLSDAEWGKGWSAHRQELYRIIARIKALKLGVVFIAHEATKEITVAGMKVDRCQPDISKAAWKNVIPLCDIVGYCGMTPKKKGGKRVEVRTLETEPRRDLFVKDRPAGTGHRTKPSIGWEPLDGAKFIRTFKGAK